jgi:hypothetical protein
MASKRQIAANRRNARKSTGPRSRAAKQRVSRNAFRHGLTLSVYSSEGVREQIEDMLRQIVGNTDDAVCRQLARTVAEAHFDLARVRQTKVALIETARVLTPLRKGPITSEDALRRALPGLAKLDRYESRAISRRDGAVRKLLERNCLCEELVCR